MGWPAFLPERWSRYPASSPSVSAMPIFPANTMTAYARSCRGVRSSEAATGTHTNFSVRVICRTVRSAD
ncbi:hypothetical protein GCM10010425_75730 [Streptomyces spororaveus]